MTDSNPKCSVAMRDRRLTGNFFQFGMAQGQYQVTFSCSGGLTGRCGYAQPAATEVEAEIRKFVRRDVVTNSGRQPENESQLAVRQRSGPHNRRSALIG